MTATRSRPCSPTNSSARGHANGFEYLGMVDPEPAAFDRLFDHSPGAGLGQLHQARRNPAAERRHPGDLGRRLAIRRSALGAGIAGHQDDRGRRVRRRGRAAYFVVDHRRPVGDHDPVRAGDQHRPRAQRRQGRRHARSRQSAAERQRAADPARRRDRPADRHLRRDLARQDAGAAFLFRRRRRQARAAGRARRGAGRAHRRCRARDSGLARSRPAAGRGADRRQCQPDPARHQCRPRRRPRRNRQERPGDPHAGRRQDAERTRRHHDPAVRRRRGAARRPRHRHRHHRRSPDLCPLQRRTGGGARHQALQGRQRRDGRRRRAEAHRRAEGRLSRCRPEADRHLGRIHQGQLRRRDLDTVRGRDPRRHRRPAVPARHSRHHHRRDLAAAVDLPGVLGDGPARLLAEPGLLPRHHAVDGHSGRRRHRRDREHRAPHAHGQVALSRGARSRRRNRPRRDRDLADHHRDLRARQLHVGHRRAVLQAVRHHGVGAGVLLAARRALRHAGARGLLPEGSSARRSAARPHPAGPTPGS